MSCGYVVGRISVKHPERWAEYRARVPGTLVPWGGELVFRGRRASVPAGEEPHPDIVVIRFPSLEAANGWHASPAYQALVALRLQAADVVLAMYEA
ncbi:MAG: DUF1330 domain-containing protein [Burkholderiaceae bacterium]|jgi:uncharacterized protein (DUF1330 family)|nr:DUF1330 domain-containing protein [Burkholderiales bacterium]MCZ8108497.1 DUF1330 domain-containing protein [Burkholderiales bacterium]MCZ8338227.1 DUF1330 domain-containing protein [Burkholderiaceae bacterium]